mgnify:CR=1 FL=1
MADKYIYNLEQLLFFSDCKKVGMTTLETAIAFEDDYEIEITDRQAEGQMDTLEIWIHMLSARHDMTREEAIEDYYNHLARRIQIDWINNPNYDKFIIDTVGDSVKDSVYKIYHDLNIKVTKRMLGSRRSRAFALGKINKEDVNKMSKYMPFKLVEDKIHPGHYLTHGNDSVLNAESPVSVTCYARGHITIKINITGVYYRACGECHKLKVGTGVVYSEEYFEKHPEIAKSLGVLYNNLMMYEEEKFTKVGIARGDIKTAVAKRYEGYSCAPYAYEPEEVIVGTTLENWRSEQYLLFTVYPRKSSLQYKPNFKFPGWTECIVLEKREEVRNWFKEERIRRKAGIMPKKNILRDRKSVV